jgi:hypothetical protein
MAGVVQGLHPDPERVGRHTQAEIEITNSRFQIPNYRSIGIWNREFETWNQILP